VPLASSLPIAESFRPEYLRFYGVLPIALDGPLLTVAVVGAPCEDALDDLRATYQAELDLVTVPTVELETAIENAFASRETILELVRDLDGTVMGSSNPDGDPGAGPTDVRSVANEPPVVRFVNTVIREAHRARASDLHLEAGPDGLRVRIRVDGVLSDLPAPPRSLEAGVVSRLKLLAEMDIAERRVPQDGHVRVRLEHRELDLRVATVPTVHGESLVIRLLDRMGIAIGLEELGMSPPMLRDFQRLAALPHGIVLATGPTGSGKTTSLYAALGLRDAVREKIITVEDPVEYHVPGVTQVPVRTKAGVTFATALRSILRQDPDVLMVGEIRDRETAAIAVQAAMTGHLIFSTLHTNDAVSGVVRLADLGVERYMIAASVEGIVAQRLVRRVCPHCPERYHPDPAAAAFVARRPIEALTLLQGRGCLECRGTGYKGRVGLFELFAFTDLVKDAVTRGADLAAMRHLAEEQGTRSLLDDGWVKVQAGFTTIEEVLRVTGA
jgi:type II secretory ATPase GspE/PulE/Tfp pilus assembly ATPase PilB-like protein